MRIQLIKNAQVQVPNDPSTAESESYWLFPSHSLILLSHSGKGDGVLHLFLMADSVDDELTLVQILSGNFEQTIFLRSFYGKKYEKNKRERKIFPSRSKRFWIWFFSCNLWKFMIYDDVRDPLANTQDRHRV